MVVDVSHAVDEVLADGTVQAPAGRESARRDAVADVEVALAVDRTAVSAVDVAQRRLDVAMAGFDVHVHDGANYCDLEVMIGEVELATRARLLAVSAEARGRRGLVAAVTVLGALWDIDTEATVDEGSRWSEGVGMAGDVGLGAPFGVPLQGVVQSPTAAAAAAVVAEATAIAVAADAQVAAETKASVMHAARIAENAVREAAVTVARAAESARAEQESAVADAAAVVAAEAVRTAIVVRARAAEVAASVGAFAGPALPRSSTDIAVVYEVAEHAAEAQARDTAGAAEVVAIMVAASAAAVAAAASTLAAATAQHVHDTAEAVQAVADAAAREIAATTAGAARAAAKAALLRQAAGQIGQIYYA